MATGIDLTSEERRRRVILFIMGATMLATSAAVSNVRALFAPGDLAAAIQQQQGGSAFAAFAGDPLAGGDRRLAPAARFIRNGGGLPGGVAGDTGVNQAPGLIGSPGGTELPGGSNPGTGLPGAIGPAGITSGTPAGTSGGTPGTSGGVQGPSEGGEISPPFTPNPTPTPTEPLPEPETWAMMLLGIGFSGWMARRSRRGAVPA